MVVIPNIINNIPIKSSIIISNVIIISIIKNIWVDIIWDLIINYIWGYNFFFVLLLSIIILK